MVCLQLRAVPRRLHGKSDMDRHFQKVDAYPPLPPPMLCFCRSPRSLPMLPQTLFLFRCSPGGGYSRIVAAAPASHIRSSPPAFRPSKVPGGVAPVRRQGRRRPRDGRRHEEGAADRELCQRQDRPPRDARCGQRGAGGGEEAPDHARRARVHRGRVRREGKRSVVSETFPRAAAYTCLLVPDRP